MTTYDEFLTTAAVPRETIDRFLDEDDPTWARFDGVVGYTLGRIVPTGATYTLYVYALT